MGSATGLTGAAAGQLVDQDTDAPLPPCFMTSLVGGKGEREDGTGAGAGGGAGAGAGAGAETGAGAGAGAGGGGGGFGAMFGGGAEAGAVGAGAGAAVEAPPLNGGSSADDDSCWDETTLSNIRTLATNSSART